jgi:signal transduction histidine kinase
MSFSFNTIGKRLFLSFAIIFVNVLLIAGLVFFYATINKKYANLTKTAKNQRVDIVQVFKSDLDFLRFSPTKAAFYENNAKVSWSSSENFDLDDRDQFLILLKKNNQNLLDELIDEELANATNKRKIDSLLENYNVTFIILVESLRKRGFKDFGLEGTMRSYAHQLETNNTISLNELLTLRRYEKDFFLRKENIYKVSFKKLVDKLINKLTDNPSTYDLLTRYRDSFERMTELEQQIGLSPEIGLMGKLTEYADELSSELEDISVKSEQRSEAVNKRSFVILIGIGLISLLLSSIATYFIAAKLTKPIKSLSKNMEKFMLKQDSVADDFSHSSSITEIQTLYESFFALRTKLKIQFEEINKKSAQLADQNLELTKLNEDLDRFIYSAAHDLKSPLDSLLGLINIAQIDLAHAGKGEYFVMMRNSIAKLSGFIKDITDYARNKRQDLTIVGIDMEKCILNIFSDLTFLPNYSGLKKEISVTGGLFYSDKTRLEIVLKNLISNAFRYSDPIKDSYIHIKVAITSSHMTLTMADNGVGIAAEHLPKIFEMFYRASQDSKGTGLGLFLVRESVKILQGEIAVSSKLGEGTTFILELPNLAGSNKEETQSRLFQTTQ